MVCFQLQCWIRKVHASKNHEALFSQGQSSLTIHDINKIILNSGLIPRNYWTELKQCFFEDLLSHFPYMTPLLCPQWELDYFCIKNTKENFAVNAKEKQDFSIKFYTSEFWIDFHYYYQWALYISGVRTWSLKVKPKMAEIDVQCQSFPLFLSARSTQIDVQCQSLSIVFRVLTLI